jgi:hypothetical protein
VAETPETCADLRKLLESTVYAATLEGSMTTPAEPDLVPWLREQIAETRTWARDALDRLWIAEESYLLDENGAEVARFEIKADAAHAALNDPSAVLAQCEAHELILNLAETVYVGFHAVTALGLAYQHRPGYREEWRP